MFEMRTHTGPYKLCSWSDLVPLLFPHIDLAPYPSIQATINMLGGVPLSAKPWDQLGLSPQWTELKTTQPTQEICATPAHLAIKLLHNSCKDIVSNNGTTKP